MRKLLFYARLAWQNLVKNRLFYGPNLLACSLCSAMLYIIRFLFYSEMIPQMRGSAYVSPFMGMGTFVLVVVIFSILMYVNGFIIKRRQTELGLYHILGMEKRQVAHVLILETIFLAILSLILGLAAGILFSKLALLGLLNLLQFPVPLGFSICWIGIGETVVIMGVVFLALILRNLWILHLSRPVDLLRAQEVGETEPRSRKLTAAFGLLCLLGGYAISLTTRDALSAVMLFFPAVLLVIIGNRLLFTTVSVVVLKALKKNKRFYYKPRHFTAVSGMLYRMKQNAKSLHTISILATMLLVTISTTVCLYAGTEDIVDRSAPDEVIFEARIRPEELLALDTAPALDILSQSALDNGCTDPKPQSYLLLSFAAQERSDGFSLDNTRGTATGVHMLDFITLEDYNRLTGASETLAPDQVLYYQAEGRPLGDALTLDGHTWQVKSVLSSMPVSGSTANSAILNAGSPLTFVVADRQAMLDVYQVQAARYEENRSPLTAVMSINPQGTTEQLEATAQTARDRLSSLFTYGYSTICRASFAQESYANNGSFLFLGLFLGIAFLIATVLMIYYKQLSEGYEDRQRFIVLQKVGMSQQEVRGTIRTQVLMIFFLPLLTAALHMAFAFPMIFLLLTMFNLRNVSLFVLCCGITLLIFAVTYVVIYLITARKYYQIVKM